MIQRLLITLLLFFSLSLSTFAAVDLNTATQADLEEIKGIGPVKAKAIINYRKQHGDFKSIEELDNVHGIGEATLTKLKSQLFVTRKKITNNLPMTNKVHSTVNKNNNIKTIKADRPAKEPIKESKLIVNSK
ncbi:helix-hairpin-helix domain-containing protein [Methylotenera sp.]|uniref:ComEA family DNA-binding protein n=1 Tax=Methylotenera sp. TaxID=2051956 RepID=UPI0025E5B177|nr:helix-hairpin-helix domain-containing protein [Methylotenera sp.]